MVPALPDGVMLESATHPWAGLPQGWTIIEEAEPLYGEISQGFASALAHSMRMTKELVGVNVLHRGFDPDNLETIEVEV